MRKTGEVMLEARKNLDMKIITFKAAITFFRKHPSQHTYPIIIIDIEN